MTDEIVNRTMHHFQSESSELFGEAEAILVLLSLSQLLDATGMLKLEVDDE